MGLMMSKIDIPFRSRFDSAVFFKKPPTERSASLRRAENAEIIVMLGGVYQARLPGEHRLLPLEARAGDVVCWPENALRTEDNPPDAPPWCICIYFWWRNPPRHLPLKIQDRDGLIRILADRLLTAHMSPTRDLAVCNAFLAGLLGEYVHLAGQNPKNLAERVSRYVEEHMSERTQLEDLARAFGLNKHHLGRKYKALTGRTPMQDVRQRKVERARALLLINPKNTLKAVAIRTGIGDEHQLSRLLSRYQRLSVRDIRRLATAKRASRAVRRGNRRKAGENH